MRGPWPALTPLLMAIYARVKDNRRSHTSRDDGSVPRVSPITASGNQENPLDFQSTQGLSEGARATLDRAFDSGWLEPQKLHHGSAHLRNLLHEARESIATNLKVAVEDLEFVGELGFGYWSVIAGSLKNFSGTFIHGATDRQVVHAFARDWNDKGMKAITAEADGEGLISYQAALDDFDGTRAPFVLVWQGSNRETGVGQQNLEISVPDNSLLIADMTAMFRPDCTPNNWGVALWDPRNFGGPEGLAILAIRPDANWNSPIPKIDRRRLFDSYSKPLLLVTAVALEERIRNLEGEFKTLRKLRSELGERLKYSLSGVKLVGESNNQDPRRLALVVDGVAAEEILRQVEKRGVLIDAGSACGSGALSPSHVLEAMGYGQSGHLRITLKTSHTSSDIENLVKILAEEVERFRSTI
jgi:cysteine desulfurase